MTEKEKKERDNKDSLIGLAQGEIVQRAWRSVQPDFTGL